jgi:uncharacterized protein (DUF1800 family)
MRHVWFAVLIAVATPAAAQGRELTPPEQVAHVVSRLTFGPRPGDLERVAAIGVDAWIAAQLRPESILDSVPARSLASQPSWSTPIHQLPAMSPTTALNVMRSLPLANGGRPTADSLRVKLAAIVRVIAISPGSMGAEFAVGKIINAETSERQLYEVIVDFWENHFSVYSAKLPSVGALPMYGRDAIRPRALGKFRDLLGAVAHSPAMLFYLDNHLSTADGLNENYARELLELHTLGVDGGYSQADVVDVARALTGWSIDPRRTTAPVRLGTPATFAFDWRAHDSREKVILGHRLAAGRGMEDGEELLDILARHPSTARHIATKLARRLVSDEPPATLIDRAAATFTRTDGDIAEVVRTIVTSDEFFSRAAFRAKVKSPFELVVSARRALNAPADTTRQTALLLGRFNQPTFGRISPEGWPEVGSAWINPGSVMQRMMFGTGVASGTVPEIPTQHWKGFERLASKPVAEQADGVVQMILGGVALPATRDALQATTGNDGMTTLREMLALALASPEFQRR